MARVSTLSGINFLWAPARSVAQGRLADGGVGQCAGLHGDLGRDLGLGRYGRRKPGDYSERGNEANAEADWNHDRPPSKQDILAHKVILIACDLPDS